MAHFTINPALTHVRIVVASEYQSCLEAYVATGALQEFTAMIDCIAAELEEEPGQSFGRRGLHLLAVIGGAIFRGFEIEGAAMYPAAFPPDELDRLLGVRPPEDWPKMTVREALAVHTIFQALWNPALTESTMMRQVPGYDSTVPKVTSAAGVTYQFSSRLRADVQAKIRKTLDALARQFPKVKVLATDAPLPEATAQTQTYDRGGHSVIVFSNANPDKIESDYARALADNWWKPSKVGLWEMVAIHEFGHALGFAVGIAAGREPAEIVTAWLGNTRLGNADLGGYALTDPHETLAQAFAEGLAGVKPSKAAKDITRYLIAAYRQGIRFDQQLWNACVMEIRPGQRSVTMAQAMAHNTSTVQRDAEMLRAVLEARGDSAGIVKLRQASDYLMAAYDHLMDLFAQEIAADHRTLDEPIGSERVLDPHDEQIAATAAHRAERYETR